MMTSSPLMATRLGWEYRTLDSPKPTELRKLNRRGHEGREAVAMVTTGGASKWRFVHLVLLKRQLPDVAESPSAGLDHSAR